MKKLFIRCLLLFCSFTFNNSLNANCLCDPLPSFPANLPEILVCVPDYISTDLTELDAAILANVTNGTVTWYQGNPETMGFLITNPTNVNVLVIVPDDIYAQITDNDTGCQNSTEIAILFDSTPTANAGLDISICSDSSPITLTGNLPANHTGEWFGGSNLINIGNGTAIFDPAGLAGQIVLTYTLTSPFGCEDSDDMVISVSPPTPLNVFTTDVSDCGLSNGTAVVSSISGTADIQWSNGNTTPAISNLAPGGYGVTVIDNNSCTATDYALISTQISDECVEVIAEITRINFPALGDGGSGGSMTEWVLDFDGMAWIFAVPPVGTQGFANLENLLENAPDLDCSFNPTEFVLGDYNVSAGSTASIDLIIFESDNVFSGIPHSCTYDGMPTNGSNPIDSGNPTGDDLLYDGMIDFDLTGPGIITLPLLSGVGTIEIEYVLSCQPASLVVDAGAGGSICADDDPILLTGSPLPAAGEVATWTGSGVTDNGDGTAIFDPSGLSGSQVLTYTFSNGTCVDSDNVVFNNLTGVVCDDNNSSTFNDVYNESCECFGTPVAQNLCDDFVLNVIDNPIADGTYDAIQIVISSGVVSNGSTVSHIAGDLVILNPGFTVEPDVYFVADIIPCPASFTQPETDSADKKKD